MGIRSNSSNWVLLVFTIMFKKMFEKKLYSNINIFHFQVVFHVFLGCFCSSSHFEFTVLVSKFTLLVVIVNTATSWVIKIHGQYVFLFGSIASCRWHRTLRTMFLQGEGLCNIPG